MPTGKPDRRLSFQVIFHSIKVSIKENHHRDLIRENSWQALLRSCQTCCMVSVQSQPSKDSGDRAALEDANIHMMECYQETKWGLWLSSLPVGSKFCPEPHYGFCEGQEFTHHTAVRMRSLQ